MKIINILGVSAGNWMEFDFRKVTDLAWNVSVCRGLEMDCLLVCFRHAEIRNGFVATE